MSRTTSTQATNCPLIVFNNERVWLIQRITPKSRVQNALMCTLVVRFAVSALLISADSFSYVDLEWIFLVAAHVGIAHEEQSVRVGSWRTRSYKVQLDFGFLLER